MWCIMATLTKGQALKFGAMTGGKGQIPKCSEGRTYLFAFGEKCGKGKPLHPNPQGGLRNLSQLHPDPSRRGAFVSLPMTGA